MTENNSNTKTWRSRSRPRQGQEKLAGKQGGRAAAGLGGDGLQGRQVELGDEPLLLGEARSGGDSSEEEQMVARGPSRPWGWPAAEGGTGEENGDEGGGSGAAAGDGRGDGIEGDESWSRASAARESERGVAAAEEESEGRGAMGCRARLGRRWAAGGEVWAWPDGPTGREATGLWSARLSCGCSSYLFL